MHMALHTGEATHLEIRVGNTPLTPTVLPDRTGNAICRTAVNQVGTLQPFTVVCSAPLAGRYVSIHRLNTTLFSPTNRFLTLCEVKVGACRIHSDPRGGWLA